MPDRDEAGESTLCPNRMTRAHTGLQSTTQTAKSLLRKNTAEAVARGACGLPWITATNHSGNTESFWGFDHLGQVIQFLGLEKLQSAHL